MKFKFAVSMALSAACLAFASHAHAQAYTEVGDAGDLPATAQIIPGSPGLTYSSILGSTNVPTTPPLTGFYDSDMYQITVLTLAKYTISTNTGFIPGRNNFDTQLALFNASGVGIAANDDVPSGGQLSTLVLTLSPGNYYLLLSGSGRYAVDSTNALIFPNLNDGTTDPTTQVNPTSTLPVAAYTGNTNEGGGYTITFAVAPVPEPSTYAVVLAGVAGLALVGKFRRKANA